MEGENGRATGATIAARRADEPPSGIRQPHDQQEHPDNGGGQYRADGALARTANPIRAYIGAAHQHCGKSMPSAGNAQERKPAGPPWKENQRRVGRRRSACNVEHQAGGQNHGRPQPNRHGTAGGLSVGSRTVPTASTADRNRAENR